MDEYLKFKIDKMTNIYNALKGKYSWSSDRFTRYFAALTFTLSKKEFDINEFDDVQKFIVNSTGMFSHYRTYEKFSITSLLMTKFENPKEAFKNLLQYENKLHEEGFFRGSYLALAAYLLLLDCTPEMIDLRSRKTMEIYKKMKKKHFWLTGQDDYPLAALISLYDKNTDLIINEIEGYYDKLHSLGFSKSSGLQQLSHILTFSTKDGDIKVKRCRQYFEYFKENKIRIYSRDYGLLGILSIVGDDNSEMLKDIVELCRYFKEGKIFKWLTKEFLFIISCSFVVYKYIENLKHNKSILETSIGISIEALIAVQNAAIIASIAAASAAAASSASS